MFTLNVDCFALRDCGYDLTRLTLSGSEVYKLLYEAALHVTGVTEMSAFNTDSQVLIARVNAGLLWYPQRSLGSVLKGVNRVDYITQQLLARHQKPLLAPNMQQATR